MMPFCATTSPLRLVASSSETKQRFPSVGVSGAGWVGKGLLRGRRDPAFFTLAAPKVVAYVHWGTGTGRHEGGSKRLELPLSAGGMA